MKIIITKSVGGHEVGTELDLPDSQAAILIANGVAEEAKARRAAKRGETDAGDATK